MEELKKHLQSYLTPESGLVGVVLSDREGVPLVRVTGEACPDAVTRTSFLSSFAGTSQEVGGKLGLGTNNTLVAVYGQYQVLTHWKYSMPVSNPTRCQVVHHQHEAVILTLVAGSEASTGLMISMTETMRPFLADVSAVISDPPQRSTPF